MEDVLAEHPAVLESAVVGVPDEKRGETVKAFVSLRPGTSATPEELVAHCRERMAAYKYPRSVVLVDELPKTVTGKILRRELRAKGVAAGLPGKGEGMTTPRPENRQPRDIALELGTPEQAADLAAQSSADETAPAGPEGLPDSPDGS